MDIKSRKEVEIRTTGIEKSLTEKKDLGKVKNTISGRASNTFAKTTKAKDGGFAEGSKRSSYEKSFVYEFDLQVITLPAFIWRLRWDVCIYTCSKSLYNAGKFSFWASKSQPVTNHLLSLTLSHLWSFLLVTLDPRALLCLSNITQVLWTVFSTSSRTDRFYPRWRFVISPFVSSHQVCKVCGCVFRCVFLPPSPPRTSSQARSFIPTFDFRPALTLALRSKWENVLGLYTHRKAQEPQSVLGPGPESSKSCDINARQRLFPGGEGGGLSPSHFAKISHTYRRSTSLYQPVLFVLGGHWWGIERAFYTEWDGPEVGCSQLIWMFTISCLFGLSLWLKSKKRKWNINSRIHLIVWFSFVCHLMLLFLRWKNSLQNNVLVYQCVSLWGKSTRIDWKDHCNMGR